MYEESTGMLKDVVMSLFKTSMPAKYEFMLKSGMAGLGVLAAHYTNSVSPLLWLLALFSLADLITGVVSAAMTTGVSGIAALKGAVKKTCMFFLVGVGYGIDLIIQYAKDMAGLDVNYPPYIFGMLTVCYLLITEGISILENLSEIGVEVPFLSTALHKFRQKIVEKGDSYIEPNQTNKPE